MTTFTNSFKMNTMDMILINFKLNNTIRKHFRKHRKSEKIDKEY